jgi:hypothetical protein
MTANTPQSAKAKGRKFQQEIRDDLITSLDINPDDILSTSMGAPGLDIYLSPEARQRMPFGIECKRQETLSIPTWWKQCTRNAAAESLTPLLVFRRNREDALAVLRWEDLLSLLADLNEADESLWTLHDLGKIEYAGRLSGGRS